MSPMPHPRWSDCLLPLLMLVLAAGFVAMGFSYNADSRAVPELIGGAMLVLAAVDLVSRTPTASGRVLLRWLNPAGLAETQPTGRAIRLRQCIAILGVVAFGMLLVWFGVLPAVPVFVLIAIRFGARRGWRSSLAMAVLTTGLIWALFVPLLRLDLWPGVLFGGEW